ncbi:L,D-transpeptidase [Verrucomicrobiales bacterium]|nr:L,D-transpeptidase [Verrucomicrobiales bacterium]MDC0311798.1 L,D-transpeptidase [bacterium]
MKTIYNSKSFNQFRRLATASSCALLTAFFFSSCSTVQKEKDRSHVVEISVPEQKMALYRDGRPVKYFPISTSKFGLGDEPGSNRTPIGRFEVAEKIGDGKRSGTVFKSRKPTGEVVKPNSPGRDPIVSRIFWLKGKDDINKNAFARYIYIHGTPEERTIGTPASYGCIRMKSRDVIDLYDAVGWGADVYVVNKPLWRPNPAPQIAPILSAGASMPMAMAGVMPMMQVAATPENQSNVVVDPKKLNPVVPLNDENTGAIRRKHRFQPLVAGNRVPE